MMTDTFPNVLPDRNSKFTYEDKVLRADFADGYSQTAPDGKDNRTVRWILSFANYPGEEVDEVVAFLQARASNEAFYWTPPFESSPSLWKQISPIELTFPGGTAKTLTFTIQRVPL